MGDHAGARLLPDGQTEPEKLQKALAQAKLHREIAFQEMTAHRFLSDDRKLQETEFASGVKVRANYGDNTWEKVR
jgi:hypothetical protein